MLHIGQNLKKIRELIGLTQIEFAQKIGATINQQKSYELNKAKPSLLYMERLAQLTGQTAGNLLNKEISEKELKLKVAGSFLDEVVKVDKVGEDEFIDAIQQKVFEPEIDYKAAYNQSIQLSLSALLEGQALLRTMMVETRDNTREIRKVMDGSAQLLKAYEQSIETAQKLMAQRTGSGKDKASKG